MIETRVPKDIRQYESKIIGPLTTRQLVCVSLSAAAAIGLFSIFKTFGLPTEYTIYIVVICILPIMAFAVKIDGMKMEVYLRDVVMNYFMSPKIRYESKDITELSTHHDPQTKSEIKKDIKRRKKIAKKNPEFRAYR